MARPQLRLSNVIPFFLWIVILVMFVIVVAGCSQPTELTVNTTGMYPDQELIDYYGLE